MANLYDRNHTNLFLFNAVMAKPLEKQGQQQQSSPQMSAPDGGWGWVVVGALFVASALVFGLIRSLGIFFVEFVQYFDESAQAVSWITSIGVAVQQLFSKFICKVYVLMSVCDVDN